MTTPQIPERNPFMLMVSPEVVLAAMEKSERLSQLKRQLCRPLDKPAPAAAGGTALDVADELDAYDDEVLGDR